MAAKQFIALPVAVPNERRMRTLVVDVSTIKAVDIEWDREDQTYEVSIVVGASRDRYELITGLSDLMTAINMVGVDDPWNALSSILDAETSE